MIQTNERTKKPRQNRRKKRLFLLGIPLLIALLLGIGLLYLCTYYPADMPAIDAFKSERTVTETTLENGDLFFDAGADTGLIFYPGGKVDETAYVPLMRAIAAGGVSCVLCREPFHLAVFDMHAADGVRAALPNVSHWYVGGHSLGGAVASIELDAHPDAYDGLLLLAAFPDRDLSETDARVLSVIGSEDGVLDRGAYEAKRDQLPNDVTELVIDGGCHAGFGMYGAQKGDGTPTISSAEQIQITADAVLQWIRSGTAE